MKSSKSSFTFKSFEELKTLLKTKPLSFPERRHTDPIDQLHPKDLAEKLCPETEEALFKKAMEGVTPIQGESRAERIFQIEFPKSSREKEDAEILEQLADLVKYGKGFRVADTPEYIEGTNYQIHPDVARRLHRGEYSIQAFIDLHGLLAEDAKEVFERFVKWAVTTGKTGLLIVHGRGLSSPAEPVLKKKVVEWLTQGPWRKWVAAYASARICDGGAGATYVLLRPRPVSKQMKKGSGLKKR